MSAEFEVDRCRQRKLDRLRLRREADTLDVCHGQTAYSRYLREHGRRPSPAEAAGMGKAIGARVMADDGNMYPLLTAVQKAEKALERERRRRCREAGERISRLRSALVMWPDIALRLANDNIVRCR